MYANWDFYINEYLLGKEPVMTESDFPFSVREASRYIDKHTFMRVRSMIEPIDEELPEGELDGRIPRIVSEAACALGELYYKHGVSLGKLYDRNGVMILPQGISAKQLTGFDPAALEEQLEKSLQKAISTYLAHTGLLFRGNG
jgi:hypothetical protein